MDEPYLIGLGKYRGEPITRIPVSYLKWMVSVGHTESPQAVEELERRGTKHSTVEVSAHAVDRASQRCLGFWMETRKGKEGLHSWLCRIAEAALTFPCDKYGNHFYGKFIFTFHKDCTVPLLLTIKYNLKIS